MGKNGDLSDFKSVVGAGQAGVSISGSADLLGIFTHNHLWGWQNGLKKRKDPAVVGMKMPRCCERSGENGQTDWR